MEHQVPVITEPQDQLPAADSIVFVLDASDAGFSRISQAIDLLGDLSQRFPNFANQKIMFLGGSQSYRAGDFEQHRPEWGRENSGRLSVLAPVYEALPQSAERIVVLAAFRIFDLADWTATAQFHKTLFVRLGAVMDDDSIRMHAADARLLIPLILPQFHPVDGGDNDAQIV